MGDMDKHRIVKLRYYAVEINKHLAKITHLITEFNQILLEDYLEAEEDCGCNKYKLDYKPPLNT